MTMPDIMYEVRSMNGILRILNADIFRISTDIFSVYINENLLERKEATFLRCYRRTVTLLLLLQQDANSHGLPHRSCVIIIVLIVQDLGAASANTACKLHSPKKKAMKHYT